METTYAENKNSEIFPFRAPTTQSPNPFLIKTNIIPWGAVIPNIGCEYGFADKWSVDLNALFSPWKISSSYSIKTVSLLPEIRFWIKNNVKGSFFDFHGSVAWFNVRWNEFRYQDTTRPLIGAGIGYGYRLSLSAKWNLEFTIGGGFISAKYDRFFNVENGALSETRVTTYWGIDRFGISLVYNITE